MGKIVITDNVQDSFDFAIRDKDYKMRYPLTEEVEKIQEMNSLIQEAESKGEKAEAQTKAKELEELLYSFISPVGHDTPFKDVISKENVLVLRNFNAMIKTMLAAN